MAPTGGPAGAPGCCDCGVAPSSPFTVSAMGCNFAAAAAVAVTIQKVSDSSTVSSGFTDASGNYKASIPADNYRLVMSHRGFLTHIENFTQYYPGSTALSVSMTTDPDYLCCGTCPVPISKYLTVTDNNGSHGVSLSSSGVGTVCYEVPNGAFYPYDDGTHIGGTRGSAIVSYRFLCSSSGGLGLDRGFGNPTYWPGLSTFAYTGNFSVEGSCGYAGIDPSDRTAGPCPYPVTCIDQTTTGVSASFQSSYIYNYGGNNCLPCIRFSADLPPQGRYAGSLVTGEVNVYQAGVPVPPVQVCLTVQRPFCHGAPGPGVPGIAVSADGVSGTTGGNGVFCWQVSVSGPISVTVTENGCPVTVSIPVTECDANVNKVVEICCASQCIKISGIYADSSGTAIGLEGATVTVKNLAIDPVIAGPDGVVCIDLDIAGAKSLPYSSTDCMGRRASVAIHKDGWLDRCLDVVFPCGQTRDTALASPVMVDVNGLQDPTGADRFTVLPAGLQTVCPDAGCATPGWTNRGVVTTGLYCHIEYLEYEYYTNTDHSYGGTAWYSLLPLGVLTIVATVDPVLLAGGTISSQRSPYGTDQRVEWRALGTGNWVDRTAVTATTDWGLFVGTTGATFLLLKSAPDPAAPVPSSVLNIPSGYPEGSDTASVAGIAIKMNFLNMDPCDFVGSGSTVTLTNSVVGPEATGRLRWRFLWTQYLP